MLKNVFSFTELSKLHNRRWFSESISSVLQNKEPGDTATIKGWIKSLRKQKQNVFIDLSDGSTDEKLQIVLSQQSLKEYVGAGSSIEAIGTIGLSPKGQKELSASEVRVYGECVIADGYPFSPKKQYAPEYIRQYLHFRPRTNKFASLLRVRSSATLAIHNFFNSEGYFHIHAPILTSNDCEGAGEVFKAIPDNLELLNAMVREELPLEEAFFGKQSFLSVSGQLHLEAAAHGLSKVFSFGPTFRAENSRTRFHLSEFYMVEAEIAFLEDFENLTSAVEKLVKNVTKNILDTSEKDVKVCHGENNIEFSWLDQKFPILSFEEAVNIIKKNQDKFAQDVDSSKGLTKEHEIFLVDYTGGTPLFVIDWPARMKPFYMRECKHDSTKVSAFDLLAPSVGEVVGGSLRENDYDRLKEKLNATPNLDWYLDLRKFGGVPTGGYGLGFERYLMTILGIKSIKDVIPFPRWSHNCSM